MTDTTLDQQPPTPIQTRRRRTDADRLADMQAELAKLRAAGEAKANAVRAEAVAPKPARTRTRQGGRPQKGSPKSARRDDDDLDSELSELVDGFVAALRDVIRR